MWIRSRGVRTMLSTPTRPRRMAPICGLQSFRTVQPGSRLCGYPQVTESYTHDGALCTQASQVIHRHSVDSDLSTGRTNGSWSMAWPSTLGVLAVKG